MKEQWLSFRLANEWYLHPIKTIREVIPYRVPEPVPGSGPEVLGILNSRGQVITLLSGYQLLALPDPQYTEESKTIVFDNEGERFGLVVDEVAEINAVANGAVEGHPPGHGNDFVTGTVKLGDRLLITTDFTHAFSSTT